MKKPKEFIIYKIECKRDFEDGKYKYAIKYKEGQNKYWDTSDNPVDTLDECLERIKYYKLKGKIEIIIK